MVRRRLSRPGSPERERYIFRNGTGPDGSEPPNDWQSLFGGSAWEPVGDGQFYFHCFAPEQPDLNWENEEVRADFRTTMRFWSDRGVDGFRIDVAHGLRKDMSEPYAPWGEFSGDEEIRRLASVVGSRRRAGDLRRVADDLRRVQPPRFAVAEASVHPTRRARYASPGSLGQAFNFAMQDANFSAVDYREVIDSGLADMINSGSTTTWLLGCHDTPRVATRYGLPLAEGEAAQKVSRALPTTTSAGWIPIRRCWPSIVAPSAASATSESARLTFPRARCCSAAEPA